MGDWSPSIKTAALALFVMRSVSALLNHNYVSDCDEVMNYWEPTHFLLYRYGFQTWEYSPEFGLRSYLYIFLHYVVALIISFVTSNKIVIFFGVRMILGFVSGICELYFYDAVRRCFGNRVGLFTFVFLLFSPGMFLASTAYLPSSFSMYALLIAFGAWFKGNFFLAVLSVAFGTILGWPFCVAMTIPLAIDSIRNKGIFRVIGWGILSLFLFLVPMMMVDYHYYKKLLIAPLNIIMYNVFSNKGPELYGVEPWTYYFINASLNFNVVFPLALLSLPILFVYKRYCPQQDNSLKVNKMEWYFLPMYIWLALMTKMPHKEERFLFVMYPLVCLCAAATLSFAEKLFIIIIRAFKVTTIKYDRALNIIKSVTWMITLIFIFFSFSRIMSTTINYSAPARVYYHLYDRVLERGQRQFSDETVNICVGKEWYRFPSNFFLPSSKFALSFIESGFNGQLPKPYSGHENATWIIPTDMNDLNRKEPSRYINLSKCHYLVDFEFESQSEPRYSKDDNWRVIYYSPFLNSAKSHPFFRAFYIPYLSKKFTSFDGYVLLKNVSKR